MRIRTTSVALVAVAAFALAGCSSGGSDDAAPVTPAMPTTSGQPAVTQTADGGEDALTVAVRVYSAAYFKPDADAGYALLSSRCQQQVTPGAYAAEVKQAVATYGHQKVQAVTVDQVSGDLARVSYSYSVPVLTQKGQPWTREHGAWRYDAC